MVWIQFVACLAIIIVAGTRLSKYGDIIAEKTGLGHIWVGIVLLATVTSLPEVATGISSVAIIKNPDLAIGDLFGASLLNLTIIAVIDVLYTKGPILHFLGTGIVLATILGTLLIAAFFSFLDSTLLKRGSGVNTYVLSAPSLDSFHVIPSSRDKSVRVALPAACAILFVREEHSRIRRRNGRTQSVLPVLTAMIYALQML